MNKLLFYALFMFCLLYLTGCDDEIHSQYAKNLKANDTCYYKITDTVRKFVVIENDMKNCVIVASVENSIDRSIWSKEYFIYRDIDRWIVKP